MRSSLPVSANSWPRKEAEVEKKVLRWSKEPIHEGAPRKRMTVFLSPIGLESALSTLLLVSLLLPQIWGTMIISVWMAVVSVSAFGR